MILTSNAQPFPNSSRRESNRVGKTIRHFQFIHPIFSQPPVREYNTSVHASALDSDSDSDSKSQRAATSPTFEQYRHDTNGFSSAFNHATSSKPSSPVLISVSDNSFYRRIATKSEIPQHDSSMKSIEDQICNKYNNPMEDAVIPKRTESESKSIEDQIRYATNTTINNVRDGGGGINI